MTDLHLAPKTKPDQDYDRLSWGIVELVVTDLGRAVAFWTTALGLIERDHVAPGIALGTRNKTLFILHSGASRPAEAAYTGMYHVAVGVRTQATFSQMLARLIHLDIQISPTDHLMAKSIYFSDPDGLEIELTFETPDRFGRFGDMSKGLQIFDVAGRPHSGRAPLDITAELAHATHDNLMSPLLDDAYLAHLHFRVASLTPALAWFETVGFERHMTLNAWGFADMGAGQPNTHRLAMNVWSGTNHPPAPNDMARLAHYELIAQDTNILNHTRLQADGDVLRGHDPAGVAVSLRMPPARPMWRP